MREILWHSEEVANATRTTASGQWQATGVSIDSRKLEAGDLFIALSGAHHDGHDFVPEAFARGAVAALVSRPLPETAGPLLIVDDTNQALEALARQARNRLKGRVSAITGSVGKTGVKDALHHVLAPNFRVHATQGNLNNQIGLPLTLARTPLDTEHTILELGAGRPGDIAPLARLAQPHSAIIVSIGQAHAENFSSLIDIALEKAAIFTDMQQGTAILPRDNPFFALIYDSAREQGARRILSFGSHPEADVRLISRAMEGDSTRIRAVMEGQEFTYHLGALGHHWAINSLAILAAIAAEGGDLVKAVSYLATFSPRSGRGNRQHICLEQGDFILIDESYNANPSSMRAAISVLGDIRPASGGRRIVALGDMLELGESTRHHHAALAHFLIEAGIDLVFAAGQYMQALYHELPPHLRGGYAQEADHLVPEIAAEIRCGDIITVKGSKASRMSLIADALRAREHLTPLPPTP